MQPITEQHIVKSHSVNRMRPIEIIVNLSSEPCHNPSPTVAPKNYLDTQVLYSMYDTLSHYIFNGPRKRRLSSVMDYILVNFSDPIHVTVWMSCKEHIQGFSEIGYQMFGGFNMMTTTTIPWSLKITDINLVIESSKYDNILSFSLNVILYQGFWETQQVIRERNYIFL